MAELDTLLQQAVPPTADMADAAVTSSALTLAAALVTERRRRVRRRTVVVAAAAAMAIAAPVAAGTVVAVRTGMFGRGGEEGTGEFVRLDSPQFAALLDDIRRQEDLPLPPGASWDGLLHQYDAVDGASLETTSGVALSVEEYARCQWQGAFIRATRGRDIELQHRAADVIAELRSWPQLAKQPDPGFRQMLDAEAAAAARGEAGYFDRNYDGPPGNIAQDYTVNCTGMQVGQ